MPGFKLNSFERRLGVPFTLLILALLALIVSLVGLVRTVNIADERASELHSTWLEVRGGTVQGRELVTTDRLVRRASSPIPVVHNAARWSLGLAIASLLLLMWLVSMARRVTQTTFTGNEQGQSEDECAAVMKLMGEMAPLASGDLRVQATVTEGMTGSLADAFNYAVSELRWLAGALGNASQQVHESVGGYRESADSVALACSEQSRQIHQSSNYLMSMSATMSELSADAAESSVVAQSAVEKTAAGVNALSASLKRLSTIREDAESTTRLMHRLVDNVAAIDERVVVIQDVARQTDLLALNTTIRASAGSRSESDTDAAADLGRLSDEVAQLAEILGQATRDIGSLTRTISEDAADTVQSMEHTSGKLSAGVAQTQRASVALEAIQEDTHGLRERVVAMAKRTVEQSGIVRQLSENMNLINLITQQTAEGVSNSSDSLDQLQELADELKNRLADFQLPPREVTSVSDRQISNDPKKTAIDAVINE